MEYVNRRKRILFYARVSTKNESQAESCANQMKLCMEFLANNPDYELAEPIDAYIDDGLSGKSDLRDGYLKMIDRVMVGDIDFIVAKDCYRLCRSTEVSSSLNKMCVEYGFKIKYLPDKTEYNPYSRQDRMLNGFKALMGEDYVMQQSENGKIYHAQKCNLKILNANNVRFGYRWNKEKKCMEVNEEEAKVVQQIFEWYVFNDYGTIEIANKLAELGIYGKRSKKTVAAKTIANYLVDTAYIGKLMFNKKSSVLNIGVGAKSKTISIPKEKWIEAECPAIISEELFNLAQEIRAGRRNSYKPDKNGIEQGRFKGKNLFAGKIFCAECGTQFVHRYSDRKKTIGVYKDYFSEKTKASANETCENRKYNKIHEETIKYLVLDVINQFILNKDEYFEELYSLIKESALELQDDDNNVIDYKKQLKKYERDLESAYEAWAESLSDINMKMYFEKKINTIRENIEVLKNKIHAEENKAQSMEQVINDIKLVEERLEEMKVLKELTRDLVLQFVDRITIDKKGIISVILKFNIKYDAELLVTYNEAKGVLREGGLLSVLKRVKNIIDSAKEILSVYMMGIGVMTEVCQQFMLTAVWMCCLVWKICF